MPRAKGYCALAAALTYATAVLAVRGCIEAKHQPAPTGASTRPSADAAHDAKIRALIGQPVLAEGHAYTSKAGAILSGTVNGIALEGPIIVALASHEWGDAFEGKTVRVHGTLSGFERYPPQNPGALDQRFDTACVYGMTVDDPATQVEIVPPQDPCHDLEAMSGKLVTIIGAGHPTKTGDGLEFSGTADGVSAFVLVRFEPAGPDTTVDTRRAWTAKFANKRIRFHAVLGVGREPPLVDEHGAIRQGYGGEGCICTAVVRDPASEIEVVPE